ncbi:MAG: SDR family oxidoreductase [Betaproteobacteria bacterium]|nr:SDR family oxidoreductase [Betaproteobacteria bacterium]
MDMGLKDKVAVVTGAGGAGIGNAIALTLAREGAHVVTNDIKRELADKSAEQVEKLGVRSLATYADVTSLASTNDMAKQTLDAFGRIDVLVSIPYFNPGTPFMEQTEEDWHRIMNMTFFSMANAARSVLPAMIEQKGGSIIGIGSDAGRVGEPRMVMYGVAKAAVMNFVKGMSKEVSRHNIRLNVVSPGTTRTPRTESVGLFEPEMEKRITKLYPLRRLGKPADIADAVVFLASDRGSWITGQTLSVSGGYAM